MIGQQILNYRIDTKIGEGGMGVVYLASHLQLERKAAIKALHPTFVHNPQIRARFRQEAAALAQLKHAQIVALYDYLEEPDGLFLIMEYVQGRELDDYIANVSGPIPAEKALPMFIQVLDAFQYAHQQGIVHRDIKPSNLLVTNNLSIKVLDFGIARILGEDKSLTQTGTKMGTVLYMSPEQVTGKLVDARSDIYTLGVTLFQMLTGKCPYNDQQLTEYEIYRQIVEQPLPPMQTLYPTISQSLQAVVDKATAKNPLLRFQTCDDFKQALLSNSPPNTTTTPTAQPLSKTVWMPTTTEEPTFVPPANVELPKRGSSMVGLWVILILLLSFTGALVVLYNPLQIEQLAPYAWMLQKSEADLLAERQAQVSTRIKAFYEVLQTRQIEQIRPFFRPQIDKYFALQKVRFDPEVKNSLQAGWRDKTEERLNFLEQTLELTWDNDGTQTAIFDYEYTYRGARTPRQTVSRRSEIRFDKEGKIYYIDNVAMPKK